MLDGTLALLRIRSTFGESLHARWPRSFKEMTATETAGLEAAHAGKTLKENPYENGTVQATLWRRGFAEASQHWFNSPLVEALVVSIARLAVGFAISIVIGGFIGLLAWRWQAIDEFIGPVLLGIQTLPSVCWVSIAIFVFKIDEGQVLFVLVLGSFAAVAIALRDGLRAIPPLYQHAGRMMGAHGWRLYVYVLLPASLPALATSLRQGFSFAWRSLLGAELILGVKYSGLGHLLASGRETAAIDQVIALLIIMILIGMFADKWIFAKVQKRISKRFGLAG